MAKTGRPNGLALDRDGDVWCCETLDALALRLEPGRSRETVLTEVEGVPLLWPNDLCFGPDGALYVTDSGLLVRDFLDTTASRDPARHVPMAGIVFRFDPATGEARILDDGYRFTNGIAFGPDGLLYTNETIGGNVYRYRSTRRTARSASARCSATCSTPPTPSPGCAAPTGWRSRPTAGCSSRCSGRAT